MILFAGITMIGATAPSTVIAQDDIDAEFGDVAGPGEEPPVDEAPADDNAGQAPAGEDGGAGDAAGGGAADSAEGDSLLGWVLESLGYTYMIVFLLLSVTLVSLFVMNMLAARRDTLCPQELVESFEEKLNAKQFQEAYDMARTDESVLGQVLSAGLAKISRGYNKAIEGMQEVGEEESMKLEHRLSYMALIGNLSPMIGLFGTVQGMIESFRVIATSPQTPKPSELAEGISTALFTTLVGLAIAIPAIAAYNILRNRVARLLLEVGVQSENLMSRFEDIQPGGTAQ
ncbi:MotA/TolQ/ExbB proton channel family protein [Roseiconus lacunae]|uniref:MotA/TolQ/ExbB proton channel family protein n=2 Tax=Roseiconus lacunae TaxID=2605694 RepID=A0ABT7PFV2_9BACT|nr:MotA/TolQ/ExbB proton channel family protein [Roseiconus lacunae]MCD0462355.1 MotA/TolQ/ExbB proton channel family protein [Roseiconus lacunae]MDM4015184.1 MotA/TolQ/ExbB proton channel family protein [Roseiconus lacunae]WRQ53867.1 MotA/TolQ/ExbB proton channel family protein [Stieleria sp. HD01]